MKGELKVTWKRSKKKYRGFSIEKEKNGVLPLLTTANVNLAGGSIKSGLGLETMYTSQWNEVAHDMTLPDPDSIFYVFDRLDGAQDDKDLGYLSTVGEFYLYEKNSDGFVKKTTFAGKMKVVTVMQQSGLKTSYYTMFAGEGGLYVFSTLAGLVKLSGARMLPMGCFCGGRAFFVGDAYTVLYSSEYRPDVATVSLNGAGKITLPSEYGPLVGIETLFDKVYLFYERAIARIDVRGNPRDMRVESVAYGGGKIFPKTIRDLSVAGGKVFFLAQDGLYAMNEHRVWRIIKNTDLKIARNAECASGVVDGTYIVSFKGVDGWQHAIAVDANSDDWFWTVPFKGLVSCGGESYCVANWAWQKITFDGKLPDWKTCETKTAWTDFGVDGLKTLEKIELFGDGKCSVTLSSPSKELTVECTFENGRAAFDAPLRGREFCLRFVLEQGCEIRGMEVTMQSLKTKLK